MTKSSTKGHIETDTPHWIEWATGILSALVVIAILGWLVWDIYRYEDGPAEFQLSVVSIEPSANGSRVTFDIHNSSQSTAAQVHVLGELQNTDGRTEMANVIFDYVASESHDKGTLFFRGNPTPDTLQLRVAGYTEP